MADSPAQQIRDLLIEVRTTTERIATVQRDIAELKVNDDRRRDEIAAVRQESALLRQQFDEDRKRSQEWGRRWWGLVGLVAAAILSASPQT